MSIRKTYLTGGVLAAALAVPAAGQAATFKADLLELNNSGVSGNVIFDVADDRSTLRVRADVAGLPVADGGATPHVNHIHGRFDDDGNPIDSKVPTLDPNADMDTFELVEDTNGDGLIQVLEGVPAYGDVLLSLEKPNPTPESNHNGPIDDDGDGMISYDYTYDLTDDLIFSTVTGADYAVEDLFDLTLREYVIHGGFETDGSFSATLPVASAQIEPVPLPAAGVFLLAGLGGLGIASRRRK